MERTLTKLLLKLFSAILLAAVCILAYIFRDTFVEQLENINYSWMAAGFVCYFANYSARACRIMVLIQPDTIGFRPALTTVSFHGFLTYILPFKTGELSLPFLLTKQGVRVQRSVAVLIKCRLLDLSCLGALLVISLLVTESSLHGLLFASFIGSGLLLAATPSFFKLLIKSVPVNWVKRFRLRDLDTKFLTRFTPYEFLMSFVVWISIALSLYCVVKSLGLTLTISDTMCLVAIQLPLQLIPIQGIASAGNHEASWLAGLSLFGVSIENSIAFAISSHILLTGYVISLGMIALLILSFYPLQTKQPPL